MADSAALKISVPGKTFLLGEYLALQGGPSLIACTSPRFELSTVVADGNAQASGGRSDDSPLFHPESPAGRLLRRDAGREFFRQEWLFLDPHQGAGGLGASSAQFIAAWVALHGRPKFSDWRAWIDSYRNVAWNGHGQAPSGADVVAQALGGITLYDGRTGQAERVKWAFEDLSFTLIRTGIKLPTHEHLRTSSIPSLEAWRPAVERAALALRTRDGDAFVQAVNTYGDGLRGAGLVAPETEMLLAKLRAAAGAGDSRVDVRGLKGCGAMGADIILIIHGRAGTAAVREWCVSEGLSVCGGDDALTEGVEIEPHEASGFSTGRQAEPKVGP